MVGTKRRRDNDEADDATPQKLRTRFTDHVTDADDTSDAQTPSRRARPQHLAENGTPRSILKKPSLAVGLDNPTPTSNRKLAFDTPTKTQKDDPLNGTPTIVRNADRSARRKSNRRMLQRAVNGGESDEEASEEEDGLAEQILAKDEEDRAHVGAEDAQQEVALVPDTPSKRGRGRPKGSGKVGRPRKQRSPTPPTELPPHEEYFYQNRPGGAKTSNNTLSAQTLLNHDEFFQSMQTYHDRHEPEMQFLDKLHGRAYDQWIFELEEGFNVCLYGYGSKRVVVDRFTERLYKYLAQHKAYKGTKRNPKIAVINGYAAGITVKDVLTTIASTIVPANTKLPNQSSTLLDFLLETLTTIPPAHPVPVIINSIDSQHLRKVTAPSMLARLAAHPAINLICTADTPNFSLLWDVGLKTQYKFLFHDATTFAPYDAEIDVVESVNELLGRSGRRVGGKDGVGFVLRSLPENARKLFSMLIMEQLSLAIIEDGDQGERQEMANGKGAQLKDIVPQSTQGIEYRVLYHKAVQEFICSNEVGFRTLLKEFHDHQMIESRKDGMGTERLWVPFRQEELEGLAEELAEATL
ncbi:origin recognition complex subunit 2-domain-containing protein [Phaeosphaeria sp. MPI-PUGE-AT-0046c]|nr:origin recognition complex subunit 2-domain-containing protein [Phaeosphaeria sp. MPI-PUGE-AT-0046c]